MIFLNSIFCWGQNAMGNDPGDGTFNFYIGEHMLLRGEPATVKAEVLKLGIDLNDYKPVVVGI